MPESGSRRPHESLAERRARRAAVDDLAVVLDAAARFLETRSRSVAEVRRRLTGAGYRTALVDEAIGRLAELGLLDDETFARAWVESRDRARPRGEHALRRELAQKGVERAVVDGVLATRRGEGEDADAFPGAWNSGPEADREEPDRAAAARLLARRQRTLVRDADPRVRLQKAYALLARNGFSPDICREAARAFVAAEAAEAADLASLDEAGDAEAIGRDGP